MRMTVEYFLAEISLHEGSLIKDFAKDEVKNSYYN